MRYPPCARRVLAMVMVGGVLACGSPGPSAEPTGQSGVEPAWVTELLAELLDVETKLVALSNEFTQEQYAWRPTEGVRSGAEVLMHVATINLVFPLFAGHAAPSSTGLTMENLPTAAPAYEGSLDDKTRIVEEVAASLRHIRTAIESTSASDLSRPINVMGEPTTVRALWLGHIGHLHEHLGQLIAFGRTNGVVPPWSR